MRLPTRVDTDEATAIVEDTRYPPGWRNPYSDDTGWEPPPESPKDIAKWFGERVAVTAAGSYIAGLPAIRGTPEEFRAALVTMPSASAAISQALSDGSHITVLTEGTPYDPEVGRDQKPSDVSEMVAATVAGAIRLTGTGSASYDTWDDDPVNVFDPKSPVWERLADAAGGLDVARAAIAARMLVDGATVDDLEEVGILDARSSLRFEELTGRKVPKGDVTDTVRRGLTRVVRPEEGHTVVSAVSNLYDSLRASNLLRKVHEAEQEGIAVVVVPPWLGYALKPVFLRLNEAAERRKKQASVDLWAAWGITASRNPRRKSTGDCYEAAGQYLMKNGLFGDSPDRGLILVHGEVAGQGPLEGTTFGHAWVLDGDTVIDRSNGRNLRMPRMLYYTIGGIEQIGNYHEYTVEQAREKMLRYQHYGPWDLKTRSGL